MNQSEAQYPTLGKRAKSKGLSKWKIGILPSAFCLLLFLLTAHSSLLTAQAQGIVSIRSGATVPANCAPRSNNGLFYKNSGANIGLYECTAANTWTYRGSLNFGGTLTPTALSGNENNYSPTNLASSFAVRIDGGASDRTITGLASGSDGRLVLLINIGSTNNLTLSNQSGSSSAANRFLFGADVVLSVNQAILLRYDGTSSRWRPANLNALNATQASAPLFCQDAGANDTYACSLTPLIVSYVTGTRYRFKANTANTGAASINFNSLGAVTIVKVAGGITTTLANNDIRAGQWVEVVYDGTNMQMVSALGNTVSPGGSDTQVQFNDGSLFGGDSQFVWDKTANTLTIGDQAALNSTIQYGFAGGQQLTQSMVGGASDTPWIGHLVQAQQTNSNSSVVGTYDAVFLQNGSTAIGHAVDLFVDLPNSNASTQVGVEVTATAKTQGHARTLSGSQNRMKQLGAGIIVLGIDYESQGPVTISGGGSITEFSGFRARTPLASPATTAAGVYVEDFSGLTTTNKYNIFSAGAGKNVFEGSVKVGTGTDVTKLAYYTATLSPAEVAANTCAEQLFTVTGVVAGDAVFVNKPTAQAGLSLGGVRASGANQVGINFCNVTGSPITPTASQAYLFGVIR